MREVVSVHVGQAGVQLSSALWQLLTAEHGLKSQGLLSSQDDYDYAENAIESFFQRVPSGHFIPRAISVDLEPTVLDEIRTGSFRYLFHPDQLISGFEDAANNFARGHYTLGRTQIDYVIHRIGKVLEMCENMQGFFIVNSYGGGTGSGFGSLLLDRLSVEFPKKTVFQIAVYPSDHLSTATVEPYNTLLSTTFSIDRVGLCNFFDNESTYSICCNNLSIPRPTYSNLNMIISQMLSSLTCSVRFQGSLNADFEQVVTNLVPYPRIHFPIFTHAPLLNNLRAVHQPFDVDELTRSAFDPANQLFNVDMSKGKYMSCCLQYRGKVTPREVNDAIFDIKKRSDIQFIEWCPTGFKVGINNQPPTFIPKSEMADTNRCVTLLANSTSISQKFLNLLFKFDRLSQKKCFVHWYVGEGMEEMEFIGARDEMEMISFDYDELCTHNDEDKLKTEALKENERKSKSSKSPTPKQDLKENEIKSKSPKSSTPKESTEPDAVKELGEIQAVKSDESNTEKKENKDSSSGGDD